MDKSGLGSIFHEFTFSSTSIIRHSRCNLDI